jgi:hypothetical protein
LRNKYRDNKSREMINELHFYHRTTYMGERGDYYVRQEKSFRYPADFMSDIIDGMASDKTKMPSCSDQYEFKPALSQHVSMYIMWLIISILLFE